MADIANLKVTARIKIKKYEEGIDPVEGQPFEIVEKDHTFIGEEAVKVLKEMGVAIDGSN